MGYSQWGCKESDMTEYTHTHTHTLTHIAEDNRELCVCVCVLDVWTVEFADDFGTQEINLS